MDGDSNEHTVVGNLVRWVKDTPVKEALARNQFDLVMALCVEDNTFPSFSAVLGECVNDSINVSDIVDFILWGACLVDMKTNRKLLHTTCALLENYKNIALRVWPTATAGDTAYRAIMFTMRRRGMDIIGDKLKYSLAMAAISSLSTELLGPVSENTYPMFFNTSMALFDVFATDVYMPHTLTRPKMYRHDEICDIIRDYDVDVSSEVAALHTIVWGSNRYIEPCLDTLRFITWLSERRCHVNVIDLYVAGMAIFGLLASHQMMSSAMPTGSVVNGYRHITESLEDYVKERRKEEERIAIQQQQQQQPQHEKNRPPRRSRSRSSSHQQPGQQPHHLPGRSRSSSCTRLSAPQRK
jgi:hypothetical protein